MTILVKCSVQLLTSNGERDTNGSFYRAKHSVGLSIFLPQIAFNFFPQPIGSFRTIMPPRQTLLVYGDLRSFNVDSKGLLRRLSRSLSGLGLSHLGDHDSSLSGQDPIVSLIVRANHLGLVWFSAFFCIGGQPKSY